MLRGMADVTHLLSAVGRASAPNVVPNVEQGHGRLARVSSFTHGIRDGHATNVEPLAPVPGKTSQRPRLMPG